VNPGWNRVVVRGGATIGRGVANGPLPTYRVSQVCYVPGTKAYATPSRTWGTTVA